VACVLHDGCSSGTVGNRTRRVACVFLMYVAVGKWDTSQGRGLCVS
jgi:hypothetical protein